MVQLFSGFTCAGDYEKSGVMKLMAMESKELELPKNEAVLSSNKHIAEMKYDGTRCLLHLTKYEGNPVGRCFSRRISEKTGWYVENSDRLPHLRDLKHTLDYTVIDGELLIDGVGVDNFKLGAILNCLPDEAVARQKEVGKFVFNAFDILFYKGYDLRGIPLLNRKEILRMVVLKLSSKYVKYVPYYYCNKIDVKAWFNSIVEAGGEGIMVKSITGRYYEKRGREYQKVKKILTRDVIVVDFIEPTKLYEGKFPNDKWAYWVDSSDRKMNVNFANSNPASALMKSGYTPVTKFWYLNQIGTIVFGVIVDDVSRLPKKAEVVSRVNSVYGGKKVDILVVGECSGLTDGEREQFTKNKHGMLNSVIEVEANEIFKDTGKLRHPRFLRVRRDKNVMSCTFEEHVR